MAADRCIDVRWVFDVRNWDIDDADSRSVQVVAALAIFVVAFVKRGGTVDERKVEV